MPIPKELEDQLREYVVGELDARKRGITLEKLYDGQQNLANAFLKHVSEDRDRFAKHQARLDVHKEWFAKLVKRETASAPHREPLPSLSADESGAIDVRIFGQRASFKGVLPVRIAAFLIVCAIAAAAVYGFRIAVSHASTSAPVAGERKVVQ